MTILVTGSNGFVGSAVVTSLVKKRMSVRGTVRALAKASHDISIGNITPDSDWSAALEGVDVVVHTAARVHVMNDSAVDPLTEFLSVNAAGTLNLAHQAVNLGVRRFVFISSIKVNGEGTPLGRSYTADDIPTPTDAYAISKLEAELGLMQLAEETGLEVVIIRPVLIYGSGVKANFHSMMRWLKKGIPLPFGAIHNKRSLVALDNLVDLIVTCIDHPAAANQTFLVSDDVDLSTTELLQRMAAAMGKPSRLLPVPAGLLNAGAVLLGKRDIAKRLLGSLQVDISKNERYIRLDTSSQRR